MKVLRILFFALAGLIALTLVAGALIPRDHVASRAARFSKPPETVWQVLADYPAYSKWAPEVSGAKRLADQNGHPVWAFEGKWAMPLEIEASDPPRRLVTRIADPKLPFGGTWTWELSPEGEGTRLVVTERGEIKVAFFRVLTRFFFGYTSTMDTYLKALGRHLGEDVTPVPGPAAN